MTARTKNQQGHPLLPTTLAALRIICPRCGSPAGSACRSPNGTQMDRRTPHFARREAGAETRRSA